jgi:murein DD-endopeptidase MepM/ murein hydrolase activator NlpD
MPSICSKIHIRKVGYYDEDGKTLKLLLKTPIKFSRLTSRFSIGIILFSTDGKHIGTDYAAPRGTPITTTASGTVIRTGYTAGNG